VRVDARAGVPGYTGASCGTPGTRRMREVRHGSRS
jgi:hypothetical protein